MSEPMTSVEIEDVLSSIRRLVSDDLRPSARAAAARPPEDADKLILTPALRVVPDAPRPAPDQGWQDDPAGAAEGGPAPQDWHDPAEAAADWDAQDDIADWSAEDPIGEVVASFGAAVDAAPQDWEAETGDPAPAEVVWTDGRWDTEVSVIVEEVPEAEVISAAPAAEAAPGWAQHEPDGVQDTGPETAEPAFVSHRAAAADTARPDTAWPDTAWADRAEAEARAELEAAGAADMHSDAEDDADGASMFDDPEDAVIDEEVLRDLVRDIIREELQGSLGERITRNVRKLVRVEINRALAARDFE